MAATALTCLALVMGVAGCGGRPTKPPPAAVQEAERVARQAARLQMEENWAGAAQAWMEAGRQFQLINRLDQLAMARHNEAMSRKELGESETARALLEEAATLNRQTGLMPVWWRNQVALVQIENEIAPEAASRRLAALVEIGEGQEVELRVRALLAHEEARLRASEGRWDEALAATLRAAEGFAALNDRAGWAAAMVTRAGFLRRQNQLVASVATWREALRAYEELSYPRGIAVAMFGLGSALGEGGKTAEAADLLRRAAGNFRALGRDKDARAAEAELLAVMTGGGR